MSSIIRNGETFHGISVAGRGVFSNDEHGETLTYAGQYMDGDACGLGVLTWSDGYKVYAEHGPDGQYDGRNLGRYCGGDMSCELFFRGEQYTCAHVWASGRCLYNGVACAPDDPHLLALIAQVAPVEVRPAAAAPRPPLADRLARFAPAGAGDRRGHRGEPPRRTPSLMAMRKNPTAAAPQSTATQRRVCGPG
jgi:hypothetical protein